MSNLQKIQALFASDLDNHTRESLYRRIDRIRGIVSEAIDSKSSLKDLHAALRRDMLQAEKAADGISSYVIAPIVSEIVRDLANQLGTDKYVWVCNSDERVRNSHYVLHGRIFKWSKPPIVDHVTGAKCHPGEDYNCRCWALPVLDGDSSGIFYTD